MPSWVKILLLSVALSTACLGQPSSPTFEAEHAEGLRQNPPGVNLRLTTADGKSVYHLSDEIRFKLSFTSSRSHIYTVEVIAAGWNVAASSEELVVKRPSSVFPIRSHDRTTRGGVCCDSRRRYISQKPVFVTYIQSIGGLARSALDPETLKPYSDMGPGDYTVFVQTRRVLKGWPRSNHEKYLQESKIVLTSNTLELKILPD